MIVNRVFDIGFGLYDSEDEELVGWCHGLAIDESGGRETYTAWRYTRTWVDPYIRVERLKSFKTAWGALAWARRATAT